MLVLVIAKSPSKTEISQFLLLSLLFSEFWGLFYSANGQGFCSTCRKDAGTPAHGPAIQSKVTTSRSGVARSRRERSSCRWANTMWWDPWREWQWHLVKPPSSLFKFKAFMNSLSGEPCFQPLYTHHRRCYISTSLTLALRAGQRAPAKCNTPENATSRNGRLPAFSGVLRFRVLFVLLWWQLFMLWPDLMT